MAHPSKVKGNTYEREIVAKFEESGIECKRAWGSNGQALGHHEEVDCLAHGELRIQAKRRKNIAKWLKPSIFVDAVVVREDRGDSYILLRLDDFLNIAGGCEIKQYPDNNREYYCVPWEIIK